MNWPLVGIWRLLTVLAVFDVAGTTILSIVFERMLHIDASMILATIIMLAFAGGAASAGALAFWARDRWLSRIGIIRQ